MVAFILDYQGSAGNPRRRRLELCYARADLFMFPSTNETYSMVLREAAAFEAEKAGRAAFQILYTPWDAVMEKVARLYTGLIARGRT